MKVKTLFSGTPDIPADGWVDDSAKTTDRMLCEGGEMGAFPGLAIGVVRADQVLLFRGYGKADLDNERVVDPFQTRFRAASVSKPITSVAFMRMAEAGLLSPDHSVYDYLPEFPEKRGDIRLQQLLSHTAGIRSYRGKEFAQNAPLDIRGGVELFARDPLLFDPGTGYHYTSLDFVLLSALMEKAGRSDFHSLLEELVLNPLGMSATGIEEPGEEPESIARFYTVYRGGYREARPVDNRYKIAGGGLLSSLPDLLRFGYAALHKELLPEARWKQLLSPVPGGSPYYGLGWELSADKKGRKFIGHTGNSVGAFSLLRVYPDEDTVVVALVNATKPPLAAQIENVINSLFNIQK